MKKQFDAATRAEAIRLADEWWNNQEGLTLILRNVLAVGSGPALHEISRWKVIIHYEEARSNWDATRRDGCSDHRSD